jgi:hypothetical protein
MFQKILYRKKYDFEKNAIYTTGGDGVNGIVSENLFFRKTVAILSEICYNICR